MNTPLRSASFGSLLALGGVLFAATVWSHSGTALVAADAAPVKPPLISLSVKQNEGDYSVATKSAQAQQAQSGGKGGKGGGGGGGGNNSNTNDAKGKAWAEITVRNLGGPATGLVINWTVYVKTSTAGNGGASITYNKVTGSSTIDLDADKNTLVVSNPITIDSSISSSSGGGGGGGKKGGGGGTTSSSSSTTVQIAGEYVEAVYNGKTVKTAEDPLNAKKNGDAQTQ
jgi:hypothetical protein